MSSTGSWRCHVRGHRVWIGEQAARHVPRVRVRGVFTLLLATALLAMPGFGASPPAPVLPMPAAGKQAPVEAGDVAAAAGVGSDGPAAATPAPPRPESVHAPVVARERWSEERARQWQEARGWL